MTVRLTTEGEIVLESTCSSEDAEILLRHLVSTPAARVDLRACDVAHTAVIQVLMSAGREVLGPPAGAALRDWVYPILSSS